MEQLIVLVGGVRQQSHELSHELVHHGQVEWAKVVVEGVIHKLLIYAEKVCILI